MGQWGKPRLEQDKAACSVVRPGLKHAGMSQRCMVAMLHIAATTESGLLIAGDQFQSTYPTTLLQQPQTALD